MIGMIKEQEAGLAEAPKAVGRDLIRAGLVAARDETVLSGGGLDYAAHPLTGTDAVLLLPLPDG